MLIFDAEKHVYKNKHTGEVYASVTSLLSKYKPPFDSQAAALKVAQREKCPVEEVLAKWKEINDASKVYGTKIHKHLPIMAGSLSASLDLLLQQPLQEGALSHLV